jgi:hypothetical protein
MVQPPHLILSEHDPSFFDEMIEQLLTEIGQLLLFARHGDKQRQRLMTVRGCLGMRDEFLERHTANCHLTTAPR